MKGILLAVGFLWQAATSRFYPDPALEVESSQSWLGDNIRTGDPLTTTLIRDMKAAGFSSGQFSAEAQREILREQPWSDLQIVRLYFCNKTISSRPAFSTTDVTAWLALDVNDVIIHQRVSTLRAYL